MVAGPSWALYGLLGPMRLQTMAGGENQAAAAALRGWRVYFNTVTIAGRRNVSATAAIYSRRWAIKLFN